MLIVGFGSSSCSAKKGQPVFPVHGKVFFDGEPATGALVIFHPVNHHDPEEGKPRAVVEKDGSFAVTTYAAGDGAPAGEYAVSIRWKTKTVKHPTRKGFPMKVATNFPERYQDPKTSRLVVRIQEGSNELPPFDLAD